MAERDEPCPGNGLCCDRPECDRVLFPCGTEKRLRQVEQRVRSQQAEIDHLKRMLDLFLPKLV